MANVLIIAILIVIVISFITPIVEFQPYYAWWNSFEPKTPECFSLTSMAYWLSSKIHFDIYNLLLPENKILKNDAWVYFISSLIIGMGKGLVTGGEVTPRHICDSVVPIGKRSNGNDWPSSPSDWKALITSWGITWDGTTYTVAPGWSTNSENFLAAYYGIPGDSPLVYGYITDRFEVQGVKIPPQALNSLLGIKDGFSGSGWYSLMLRAGTDVSALDLEGLVWGTVEPPPKNFSQANVDKQQCSGVASHTGSIMSSAGTGIGVAMLAGMAFGPIGIAVAAGVAVAGSYALSRASKGCGVLS
jgi:hypothetical protein